MSAEQETAVHEFLNWLYEHGPALDEVPREWVLGAFLAYRADRELVRGRRAG